jgi:TetR/AcrR family transcriptional repressor of mexJK operon
LRFPIGLSEIKRRRMNGVADVKVGRPPKERAKALGEHVLAVADALFLEHGYGATSIAMVAESARVGKQTLYRRFPDKAALFRKVVHRRLDTIIVPPEEGESESDPLADLRRLAGQALNAVFDPEFLQLCRIIIAETMSFPDLGCVVWENFGSNFTRRCTEIIQNAQAAGRCRPGDPEVIALCFFWSLIGDDLFSGLLGMQVPATRRDPETRIEIAWPVLLNSVLESNHSISAWL